jgi:hypothetical protein
MISGATAANDEYAFSSGLHGVGDQAQPRDYADVDRVAFGDRGQRLARGAVL